MTNELSPTFEIQGARIPRFFYGTAWKEDKTSDLVYQALQAGFTAIDTANQRKHYFEEGAGQGIKKFLASGSHKREDLFLQTKFTYAMGQDHRKPYNESDTLARQVEDSFVSSLRHLGVSYIDSYVLHGPYESGGLVAEDWETWSAMEDLHRQKKAKFLGISNVSAAQLGELCSGATIKPSFVQNRCYARTGWDKRVREICASEDIGYQGFSLLTANRNELNSPEVSGIARAHKKTIPQVIFRFCQQLGMISLTGTSDAAHMRDDLNIYDFKLSAREVSQLEQISL